MMKLGKFELDVDLVLARRFEFEDQVVADFRILLFGKLGCLQVLRQVVVGVQLELVLWWIKFAWGLLMS